MLSCYCDGDYDWYYRYPNDFSKLETKKRKRCYDCGELIDLNSNCLILERYRPPKWDIEENIYGDEVPMANKYLCFDCGAILMNLTSIGYCIEFGDSGSLKEALKEYWNITGFEPIANNMQTNP